MGLPVWPGTVGIHGAEVCREEPGGVESSSEPGSCRLSSGSASLWTRDPPDLHDLLLYLHTAFQQPCKVILRIK